MKDNGQLKNKKITGYLYNGRGKTPFYVRIDLGESIMIALGLMVM